jgi:hypothetical protein
VAALQASWQQAAYLLLLTAAELPREGHIKLYDEVPSLPWLSADGHAFTPGARAAQAQKQAEQHTCSKNQRSTHMHTGDTRPDVLLVKLQCVQQAARRQQRTGSTLNPSLSAPLLQAPYAKELTRDPVLMQHAYSLEQYARCMQRWPASPAL